MAQSKATKKFEKRHLQDTLKRRKEFKKVKQRHQLKDKKKARRAVEDVAGGANGGGRKDEKKANKVASEEKAFENMSVDDLFAGGFQAAMQTSKDKTQKRSGKRKRPGSESESDNASVASAEQRLAVGSESDGVSENEDELEAHMKELDALSNKDPEFYNYLKENDPELLDVEQGPSLDDLAELSDDGEDTTGTKKSKEQREVTTETVKRWSQALEDRKSLRVVRDVAAAFRAAAHLNDEENKQFRYTITDANAYHDLLLLSLQQIPSVLNHHIPIKQLPHGRQMAPLDSPTFRKSTQLLKSHVSTILHLLASLSDASTARVALTSLADLVPYILSFKKLIKEVARTVSATWSDASTLETTRITAFLVLQSLNNNGDPAIKEAVLRAAYQALLKGSRQTNIHTLTAINLMKNSALDLWAAPPLAGSKQKDKEAQNVPYTVAFTLIRSLAIHLRSSIKHNANEAYKQVYNWQYVHALDFWSRVLSTHCNTLAEAQSGRESPLRPLIYPLVQVTLGALRLIPTAAYFPLRFHCTRALLRISSATNTYIPLAASLFEVLQSAEMRKHPRLSTLKPLDFETSIRCSKSLLRTRPYQDGVGEQVAELLSEFFGIWAGHISFPELSVSVVVMLKRWLKEVNPYAARSKGPREQKGKDVRGNRNSKVNGQVSLVVQKIEANARWIEERRRKVDFSPKDRSQVEVFHKEVEWEKTPMGAFVQGQRKVREERKRVLEEARREEEKKRGGEGSDEEVESEEELENEDVEMMEESEIDVDTDDE